MNTTTKPTAVAYFRTSSATNVGADKDSLKRQEAAVRACAAARGLELVHEYYDAAVSGADPVDSRPGFSEMIAYMLGNGARTIIVENASRFARDLIVQETGYQMLKARGIELIAADAPDSFLSDTPTAALIRQILGAVAQFDKTTLVNKLRGARERKRRANGRCEGRKAWKSAPAEHVEAAKAAYARKASLHAISAELTGKGFLNRSGKPYGAQSIQLMVDREHCAALRAARRVAKKQTQAA
jgi:DNA invertase Pin-like site-specific DNA recombinase